MAYNLDGSQYSLSDLATDSTTYDLTGQMVNRDFAGKLLQELFKDPDNLPSELQ